jgi:hypothetical protein
MQSSETTRTALAIALIALVPAFSACGERAEPELDGPPPQVAGPESAAPDGGGVDGLTGLDEDPAAEQPPPPGKPGGPAETADDDPRVTALERAAGRTVREFVEALDQRDGALACSLLESGALGEIAVPQPRGGCAESMQASIGYRDPRGLPVWRGAELSNLRSVQIDGATARVVATIVTRFADRDEASVEDDIVYLSREGDGWLIAKPSATLYRAFGIADVPPTAISPP